MAFLLSFILGRQSRRAVGRISSLRPAAPNQPPSSTMSESGPRPPKRFALESTDSARRQPGRWEFNHVLCLQLLISCHAAHAGSLAISRSSSTRTCAGRLHSCSEEPYRRPPRDPRRRVDTSLSSSDDYAKVECPGIDFIYQQSQIRGPRKMFSTSPNIGWSGPTNNHSIPITAFVGSLQKGCSLQPSRSLHRTLFRLFALCRQGSLPIRGGVMSVLSHFPRPDTPVSPSGMPSPAAACLTATRP
ncbi:hypothetical protein K456DRAFT_1181765 [Colletotrichum gloeosporioides 23]|nr:hypothetical protein K456DRAFT_1181765 [Colletotrichum gloeosporioides 23]